MGVGRSCRGTHFSRVWGARGLIGYDVFLKVA